MKLLKSYLLSIGLYGLLFVILLLIVSLVFAYTNISDNYLNLFSYIIIIIPSIVSSFVLSKKIKNKGLLLGIGNNVICMIILLFMYLSLYCMLNNSFALTNTFYIYLAISLFCGVLGGVAGVNV